jgi:hypothetical protein
MKLKFDCAAKVATLLTAVSAICVDTTQAHATRKHDDRGSIYDYGPAGPMYPIGQDRIPVST